MTACLQPDGSDLQCHDLEFSSDRYELYTAAEHGRDSRNPIVQAIIFSRYFVPTYYICLTVVLVLVSLARHRTKIRRRQFTLRQSSGDATAWSSASTLHGSESPAAKDVESTEFTPLLLPDGDIQSGHSSGFISRIRCNLKALLLYQPRPVPALTAPQNNLPSNGTTLVILLLLGLNLFYLFYQNVPSYLHAQPFADRAGLCFVANLPVLYILGAKNNRLLRWLTGWSYEGLNIIHRRLGEWMVALACLHATGMFLLWYRVFRPLGYSFEHFVSIKIVAIGISAFACIITLHFTATGYFRQRCYELFLASHIFLQAGVLGLLFFHHRNGRPYCVAALVIWACDRFVTRMMVKRKAFIATLQIAPDGETVLLFCDIALTQRKYDGISSGWLAGQHIFITIPDLGGTHRHQSHPFTIASPAPSSDVTSGTWPLQLIIKSKTGFCQALLKYTEYHQHTRVLIDGPYGSTEVLDNLKHSDRSYLVAGGSGISVTYPLSWALQVQDMQDSILSTRTTYSSGIKNAPQLTILKIPMDQQRHHHLWLRKHDRHSHWLTMLPKYSATSLGALPNIQDSEGHLAVDLVNQSCSTRDDLKCRPDVRIELREWIRNDPRAAVRNKEQRICIVVSGPDELAREVRNAASSLVREGYNINLFVEKFGW